MFFVIDSMEMMKNKLGFSSKVNLEDGLLKFKKWADDTSPISS